MMVVEGGRGRRGGGSCCGEKGQVGLGTRKAKSKS